MKEKPTIVAKRMKELREGIKMSQAKLAACLDNIEQTAIFRYESGQSFPPYGVLMQYADFFDVSKYPVASRAIACKAVNENTTLFLGDSFMDGAFIGDYMKTFAEGKEVLNAGMSSTTSYHWERAYTEIIGATAPKNIVLHIGTNNFYDLHDAEEDTQESLKRLMMYLHTSYPTSEIFWFNITQRTNTAYAQSVTATNAVMAEWCAKYDWITCVDTCSKISAGALREDGVHPLTQSYQIFTDALAEAGCEIVNK